MTNMSDLISREAAMEAIQDLRHAAACNFTPRYMGNEGQGRCESFYEAYEAVRKMPSVPLPDGGGDRTGAGGEGASPAGSGSRADAPNPQAVSTPDGASIPRATAELGAGLRLMVNYARWQLEEGTDYHPTLPSAITEVEGCLERHGQDQVTQWQRIRARYAAPGIETGTATTEGCGPKDESPVAAGEAPSAPSHPPGQAVSQLDERLKAAGMFTIAEMMGEVPLSRWTVHAGVTDLASFASWLDRRYAEILRMRALYELGDKPKDDDLHEWVLAHAGAFGELHANFRKAMAGQAVSQSRAGEDDLRALSEAATPGEWSVFDVRGVLEILDERQRPVIHWSGFDQSTDKVKRKQAVAALICRLVNDYRAGRLVRPEALARSPAAGVGIPADVREAVQALDAIRAEEHQRLASGEGIRLYNIAAPKTHAETLCLDYVRGLIADIAALAPAPSPQVERVRHVKSNGLYTVLHRGAQIQTDTPLTDYAKVDVYQSEETGAVWVRPGSEMNDGRFETVAAAPAPSPQGEGWQPIETAPKDGTQVLVIRQSESGKRYVEISAWRRDTFGHYHWSLNGDYDRSWHPAGAWQHLPAIFDPSSPAPAQKG